MKIYFNILNLIMITDTKRPYLRLYYLLDRQYRLLEDFVLTKKYR